MGVIPYRFSTDWFHVQSRSRPELWHLVDIAYQEEPWITPHEACSCEAYAINLNTMNKPCPHIKAVRKWRKEMSKNLLVKKLARMSLCPCGFPAMRDEIPAGQEYKIPRYNARGVEDEWICGGCGKKTIVHCIMVIRDGNVGWLPMELFDWDWQQDETTQSPSASLQEASQGTADTGNAS